MMPSNPPLFEVPLSLESDAVKLLPLKETDFELLYRVASDPLIWEQHPNRERYQRPVFQNYFKGAIESGSAYMVFNKIKGDVIGCSRYYDFNEMDNSVCIGYTFLSRDCWGTGINRSLKTVMLNHAFRFVDKVIFHVGDKNIRSQKAMEKLGAINTGTAEMSYYGEQPHTNIVYCIDEDAWLKQL